MSNKFLFIIIFLSTSIAISPAKDNLNEQDDEGVYRELPKYGKVEFDKQSWLYLNLEDFEKGDKIKLDLIFTSIVFFNEVPMLFSETNDYKEINKTNEKVIKSICFQEIDGNTIDHGCNYKYELIENFKYLIIITPDFGFDFYMIGNQIIEHYRFEIETLILFWIAGFLIICLIGIAIFRIWKRRKKNNKIIERANDSDNELIITN